ncbi:hypothetical protein ACFE04_022262 [Oxalis oulophora]
MAKNRNKKKKKKQNGDVSMDTTEAAATVSAMDTSEIGASKPTTSSFNIKIKKGRPMKRSKNVRKAKATTKAIAKGEKYAQRVVKNETKLLRVKSAKSLYD